MGGAVHPSFPGHTAVCRWHLPPFLPPMQTPNNPNLPRPWLQQELGHLSHWASFLMATQIQPGLSGLLSCEVFQLMPNLWSWPDLHLQVPLSGTTFSDSGQPVKAWSRRGMSPTPTSFSTLPAQATRWLSHPPAPFWPAPPARPPLSAGIFQ